MAVQKNQHFVPRCALKPFTLKVEGLAINLHNIVRKRAIQNAPVKGQCARDYLYGKDLRAENLLKELEGKYARVVSRLRSGSSIDDDDKEWLRLFVGIQLRRTDWAIQQMRDFRRSADDKIYARAPEHRPEDSRSDTQMMHASLRIAMQLMPYLKDLKLAIFRNNTARDFITCDNPAVLTNRFHLQKLNNRHFGYSSSGAMLSMPISPDLSMLLYDKRIYSIPNATGTSFIEVKSIEDINAINELQLLAASENIYFSSWDDADDIAAKVEALSQTRADAHHATEVYVRDQTVSDAEVYRTATPEEEAAAREVIVATGFQFPAPSRWPTQIKYRSKPKTFYNGSAIGHVRKAEWLGS